MIPGHLVAAVENQIELKMLYGMDRGTAEYAVAKWLLISCGSEEDIQAELQHLLQRRKDAYAGAGPVLISLEKVLPEVVSWAVDGWLPLGKLTLLSGDPKLGKSFLTLSFASAISTGSHWPNADGLPTKKGSVIILSSEDDAADTIVPRIESLGGDLSKFKFLRGVRKTAESPEVPLLLDEDLHHLETAIRDTGDVSMVSVDPIMAYTGGVDTYKTSEVRALLSKVCAMAARHKVAFLAVNHLTKNPGGPAVYRPGGSLAFAAAARMLLTLAKDKDNPARRLLLRDGNLTPAGAPGRAFAVVTDPKTNRPTLAWEAADITVTADDALASDDPKNGDSGERAQARAFLETALADGPIPSKELIDAAKENGISESTRRRAEEDLGVISKKVGTRWLKALPRHRDQDGHVAHSLGAEHLDHLEHVPSSAPPPSDLQEKKQEEGQDVQGAQGDLSREVDTSKSSDPSPGEDVQGVHDAQDVSPQGQSTFPDNGRVAPEPEVGGEPSLSRPDSREYHDEEAGRDRRA